MLCPCLRGLSGARKLLGTSQGADRGASGPSECRAETVPRTKRVAAAAFPPPVTGPPAHSQAGWADRSRGPDTQGQAWWVQQGSGSPLGPGAQGSWPPRRKEMCPAELWVGNTSPGGGRQRGDPKRARKASGERARPPPNVTRGPSAVGLGISLEQGLGCRLSNSAEAPRSLWLRSRSGHRRASWFSPGDLEEEGPQVSLSRTRHTLPRSRPGQCHSPRLLPGAVLKQDTCARTGSDLGLSPLFWDKSELPRYSWEAAG